MADDAVTDDPRFDFDGEGPASRQLWRAFSDGVRAFVRRRLPTEADAEDVLQDIFLRIHEGVDRLEDADRAPAWVYTIARRAVADFYRTRRPPVDAVEDPPDASPVEAPEPIEVLAHTTPYAGAHDVHEEVLSWLRPMAEELPEMYRRPLVMADFEGYTQQEVADALGLSLPGAKSRVQRARVKLGELLRACCEIEFGREGRAVAFHRRLDAPEERACERQASEGSSDCEALHG